MALRNIFILFYFILFNYIFIQRKYEGKQAGVSPLQATSMAGGSIPSEKQNICIQLRANLAAIWAAELLLLRTQQKLQEEKQEDKLRILLMIVFRAHLGV